MYDIIFMKIQNDLDDGVEGVEELLLGVGG